MTTIGEITWADTTVTGYTVCVMVGPDTYRTASRTDGEWAWTSAAMTHSESVAWYANRTTPEPVDDTDAVVLDRLLADLHGIPPARRR
jgi:hypothetical protein